MTDSDQHSFSDLRVLLVEDDDIMRLSLEDRLNLEGIPASSAADLAGARLRLEKGDVDLVVSDIRLPDGTGRVLYEEISRHFPGTPVILMTAFGTVSEAVELVKAGAVDYLIKPFDMTAFIEQVRRNLSRIADTRLTSEITGAEGKRFRAGSGVLGKSPAMRRIERLVARLKEVDSSVLITGESGVGKEVVATMIHQNSRRADGPLIKVNCAALPTNLVGSELFGHERGAFTGADRRRIGRFEQAQKGTIFLDEIAEIPPETQVMLLRVIQEHMVERVGSGESIKLDVRVIAATQVDMVKAVEDDRFRSDLYWRLNVIHIPIPPLRERQDDILYLARQFVSHQAAEMGKNVIGLSRNAEAYLLNMNFPGNVREMKNMLERAVALCAGPRIDVHDLLPMDIGNGADDKKAVVHSLKDAVEEAERTVIHDALSQHDGAVSKAAEALEISRKSLWEKMKRYGINKKQ